MSESDQNAVDTAPKKQTKAEIEKENEALKAQLQAINSKLGVKSETIQNSGPKRIVKGNEEIYHDLYRLETANTVKNTSWQSNVFMPVNVPHVHHFHNIDSDGKAHDKSCAISGHFHFVYPDVDEVTGEMRAKCSEPHTIIRDKKTGARKVVKSLIRKHRDDDGDLVKEYDKHTHEVTYLRSEMLVKRVFNEDALREISKIESEKSRRMKNPCA